MNNHRKTKVLNVRRCIFGGVLIVVIVAAVAGGARKKGAEGGEKPRVSAHAGSIKANNSMNSSSSHTSTDGSVFFTRRIAVVNLSDHKIPAEVAENLAEALRNESYVETVDLFQGDTRPASGQLLYDLYISVEMPEFSSKGLLLTGREVEARLKLTIGEDFWNSHHGYHDHLSPPSISLFADSTLDHKSVSRGVEMPGNPYRQVVANISTQVCEHVTVSLGKLAGQFGDLDTLPDGLVPEYRPVPALPLPKSEVLNQVISGHGFMLNNYTVWTMESADTRDVLTTLLNQLKEEGWRAGSPEFDEKVTRYYFRAFKDNRILEAFEAREYEPRSEGEQIRLVFRYSDRMNKAQLREVLEQIVETEPVPLDTWLAFSRLMTQEQNDRVIQNIERRSDLPASAEMRVVRYLNRNDRKAEALQRLKKAALWSRLDDEVKLSEIEKLGEEITGANDWKPGTPTVEELESYGVRRAIQGDSFETEVGVDDPVVLFTEVEGKIHLASVKIEHATIPEGIFTISTSESTLPDGGRSSSASTPHTTSRPWQANTGNHVGDISWNVSVEEIGEEERFKIKIKISP